MPRYIDANKIKYKKHEKIGLGIDYSIDEPSYYEVAYKKQIDQIPTADVQEVRHGKWGKQVLITDEYGDKHIGYICPVCKKFVPNRGNYCLECGAKMDGNG